MSGSLPISKPAMLRAREVGLCRARPHRGGGWRVGDQVEVQHQAHTGAAHDLPRRLQPRRGQLEHPTRHRSQSRCPDRVIGRVAADPEDQRAVSGYVQHRQHAGERGHVSGESGQRPVLGRQPEERGRHRCRPVARSQRNHDRRRRCASRCGGSEALGRSAIARGGPGVGVAPGERGEQVDRQNAGDDRDGARESPATTMSARAVSDLGVGPGRGAEQYERAGPVRPRGELV